MKNKGTHFLVQGAAIAAVYVVLTLVFAPLSFGEVQIRFSEALTVLPFFTPAAIPGLFVGCIIANLLGGAIPVDIIFGSIATLIGAFFTYKPRNTGKWTAPIPPIVSNIVIVPLVLRYGYGINPVSYTHLGNSSWSITRISFLPLLSLSWKRSFTPISSWNYPLSWVFWNRNKQGTYLIQ